MKKVWKCAAVLLCMHGIIFSTEKLRVYEEKNPTHSVLNTSDYSEIAKTLNAIGVRFEKWEANKPLPKEATSTEILDAYREDVDRLTRENGYQSVDVLKVLPTLAKKGEIRNKFLNEHTHSEDEVRFFVEGSGLFYLHVKERVYLVLCEAGDLISIPPLYTHWFDMGSEPYFTAIRFFIEPEGWVAQFTGSDIAQNFPKFGEESGFDKKTYARKGIKAILTDIEGTTTSISFVHDLLFPYAKQNVRQFILDHQNEPAIAQVIQNVKEIENTPLADIDQVITTLIQWMDQDKKITPLKTLQGIMWEEGYRRGDFQGHLYADAFQQLKKWKEEGLPLYVYSSGSVQAQKLLFSHSDYGDITPLFSNYFDTKVGGKKEKASYDAIARQIRAQPKEVLFLSDSVEELDAAHAAGMQTLLLSRDNPSSPSSAYPFVSSFDQIDIR